jgi:colanic acid/amylovoran biosynthesis glycosyltransferase
MPNDLFEADGAGETKLRVAMFVHRFPLVSETFVINQVVGLMRLGHEVDIYSFGAQPPNAALTQPDVAQYRLLERTKHPAASPRDGLKFLRCGVHQAATLLRSQPKALARSFDLVSHRCEALLLRLLSMAWLLRDRKTYDVVHCQFGTVGRMVLPLLECGLLNGALVVAFRGSDISQFLKQRGERIYDDCCSAEIISSPTAVAFNAVLWLLAAIRNDWRRSIQVSTSASSDSAVASGDRIARCA